MKKSVILAARLASLLLACFAMLKRLPDVCGSERTMIRNRTVCDPDHGVRGMVVDGPGERQRFVRCPGSNAGWLGVMHVNPRFESQDQEGLGCNPPCQFIGRLIKLQV